MIDLLKKLYKSPDSIESLTAALSDLDAEHTRTARALSDAQSTYSENIASAKSSAELDRIDQEIDNLRRDEQRAAAAREAVEQRLQRARAAQSERALQTQWDACEAALQRRGEALAKLQAAADECGKAMIEAEDAAREAWSLLPVRTISGNGISDTDLTRDFCDLGGFARVLLDIASARPGQHDSRIWELKQKPTLAQQHQAAADLWLTARARREAPSPDLPTAA